MNNNFHKNMSYLFTKNDYFFIKQKRKLLQIEYFANLFRKRNDIGKLCNPIFLQNIDDVYFNILFDFNDYYYNNMDKRRELYFNEPIVVNDLYCYFSQWEIDFLQTLIDKKIDIDTLIEHGKYYRIGFSFKKRMEYMQQIIKYKQEYNIE